MTTIRRAARGLPPTFAALVVMGACGGGAEPSPRPSSNAGAAAATPAPAWGVDYDAARARAKKEGRRLLLAFTGSDWCRPCMKLAEEVFAAPEFSAWAAGRFELVEFDFPRTRPLEPALKARNESYGRLLDIKGFPTVVVLDADGRELARLGYQAGGAAAWTRRMDELLAGK